MRGGEIWNEEREYFGQQISDRDVTEKVNYMYDAKDPPLEHVVLQAIYLGKGLYHHGKGGEEGGGGGVNGGRGREGYLRS